MEVTREKIEKNEKTVRLALGLRNWQRLSRVRRCSLVLLAKKLRTTTATLTSMMKKGARKHAKKANDKRSLLTLAKKSFAKRKMTACAEILRTMKGSSLKVRQAQRETRPLRALRQRQREKKEGKKYVSCK